LLYSPSPAAKSTFIGAGAAGAGAEAIAGVAGLAGSAALARGMMSAAKAIKNEGKFNLENLLL
jgi:hypothetical protein